MSLALSPASPRLESSYASYNNRNSSARSSFSPDSETPRSPLERSATANIPYPAADSAFGTADSVHRNRHEPSDRVAPADVGNMMEYRRERSTGNNGAVIDHSGQDHDRIDVEMGDAASVHLSAYVFAEGNLPVEEHTSRHGHQIMDDEMDTTPDGSSSDGHDTPDPSVARGDSTRDEDAEPLDTVPGDLTPNIQDVSPNVNPPPNLQPPIEEGQGSTPATTHPLSLASQPPNINMSTPTNQPNGPGQALSDNTPLPREDEDLRPASPITQANGDGSNVPLQTTDNDSDPPPQRNDNDSEGDSSDDDNDDEDQNRFWENFQQDDSVASGEELADIESMTQNTPSATDDDHWKETIFEDLEDPEHFVGEEGKITWTLTGFHGTPSNPNREKFLRSPQTKIGALYWNIKVFPRGNDGTEYVSVYIECSNRLRDTTSPTDDVTEEGSSGAKAIVANGIWGSAAQFGCIMFNPNDPQVYCNAKSSHYFSKGNEDWGWVRFHGPWKTLHRRQHLQRRALLQNDTVEVIAYIRLVHDYTGSLWWHPPPRGQIDWDDVAKTGYRGMSSEYSTTSALVAALAPWMHLEPFQRLIMNAPMQYTGGNSQMKQRPLFKALKSLLHDLKAPIHEMPDTTVSVSYVEGAFSWHSWGDILQNGDVVEVWEALRYLLNLENSGGASLEENSRDIFDFVLTVRQRMLFENDRHLAKMTIDNAQGILDDYVKGDSTVIPWDGFSLNGSCLSSAPYFLQMELPRQIFDVSTKKWKRSTHSIKLNETIVLKQEKQAIEYTLYGMVVHCGSLEDRKYSSIVRPRGPQSPWMQYGGHSPGDVKLLTRKQAMEEYQGIGDSSEGNRPVAYVIMYIRSDYLERMLPDLVAHPDSTPNSQGQISPNNPEKAKFKEPSYSPVDVLNPWPREILSCPNSKTSTVQIFTSKAFENYSDRGFFDVWQLDSSGAKVIDLDLPRSTTLRALRERLVADYSLAATPEQCRLWLLIVDTVQSRWSPALIQFELDTPLQDMDRCCEIFKLWLHVTPLDSASTIPSRFDEAGENQAPPSRLPSTSEPLLEIHVPMPMVIPSEITTDPNGATGERIPSTLTPANPNSANAEDVTMGGTTDNTTDALPPGTENTSSDPTKSDVYILIKIFDAEAQELKALGPFLLSKKDKIGEALERLNVTDAEKSYEIFCDVGGKIESGYVKARHTFEERKMKHGGVLVVQETLASDKIKEIKDRGDCSHVLDHYAYLDNILDPRLAAKEYTRSYFGTEYFAMKLKRGHPHGPGSRIYKTGDTYRGSFVTGDIQGHGVMKYADGNVYTGDWMDNLPDGQGKMVYGATGNVYEGGWKKGKRHGKGVMQYEVAEEDEATCSICYENEMNALLYRCGHVVACVECARQVEICPVCRSPVDGVVRIWKSK